MAPPASTSMMTEYENPDGTKEYSEAAMTRIFSTRSANFLPQRPTTTFPLQYSAPLVSTDSFASIPAASMKHVGVGYGGLKGYAYVQSLEEFVEGCTRNETLRELVRQRADKVSKGVYSFEQAVEVVLKRSENSMTMGEGELPAVLDISASDEALLENNQQILLYMSKVRSGRMKEAFTEQEQELLQRLHNQISLVASRQNNTSIINKLSK